MNDNTTARPDRLAALKAKWEKQDAEEADKAAKQAAEIAQWAASLSQSDIESQDEATAGV